MLSGTRAIWVWSAAGLLAAVGLALANDRLKRRQSLPEYGRFPILFWLMISLLVLVFAWIVVFATLPLTYFGLPRLWKWFNG